MIPVTGSAYAYSYATLGEGIAWFIGWNLVLEYLLAVATVSVGWSGYANTGLLALGIHLPASLLNAPGSGGTVNLLAMLIIIAIVMLMEYSSGYIRRWVQ